GGSIDAGSGIRRCISQRLRSRKAEPQRLRLRGACETVMHSVESRQLRTTGLRLTSLGLGTAPLGGLYDDVSYGDFEAVVSAAFARGIRYFDTAPLYGMTKAEHHLGHALRTLGLRGQVVVSTKAGRIMRPRLKPDHAVQAATAQVDPNWANALPFVVQ